MKKGRKIKGFWQSKDLAFVCKGKVKKNHGLNQSKDLDFNSELAEKRWVWAEVKIWNHMILCMKRGRKIMGFWWSKDLD